MPDTQLAAAKTSLKIRARRAVKPPALAPEMTWVGSARPQSASQWATVMRSSASAMPQRWLRACR
jgi:hypothetical protein